MYSSTRYCLDLFQTSCYQTLKDRWRHANIIFSSLLKINIDAEQRQQRKENGREGEKIIIRSLFLNSLDKMDLYVLAFGSRNRIAI